MEMEQMKHLAGEVKEELEDIEPVGAAGEETDPASVTSIADAGGYSGAFGSCKSLEGGLFRIVEA